MKIRNIPAQFKKINLNKIPYYLGLLTLTMGASLLLGLLSFSGMYAWAPILPLAMAAFGLSVAYEGEIYLQNIKGALKKLFKPNYLKTYLAKEYLLTQFPDTEDEQTHPFFADYKAQLKLWGPFRHQTLNDASKKRKKLEEKTLTDMERWFALQLFPSQDNGDDSDYINHLQGWLNQHGERDKWQQRLASHRFLFKVVKSFSLLAGFFMGMGSTYLIVEALSVLPWFTASLSFGLLPLGIVLTALVAGTAYGLLTFNAMIDLVHNKTLLKWQQKCERIKEEGLNVRNFFIISSSVLLFAMTFALTVFTGGTWWTIANKAQPLFGWMKKMPSIIMGVINPIIIGFSAFFFNLQNTSESINLIEEMMNSEESIFQKTRRAFQRIYRSENWLQLINLPRIFLKLTITPLRILLFLGHLISIGVTSDRMPGIPQIVATLIAIISEGFEDMHYFMGHDHDHEEGVGCYHDDSFETLLKDRLDVTAGHNHDIDLPTMLLQIIALPVYMLAALWDYKASQLNQPLHPPLRSQKKILTFWEALDKQMGEKEGKDLHLAANADCPSINWQEEQTIFLIENHIEQQLAGCSLGQSLAQDKVIHLRELMQTVRHQANLEDTLNQAQADEVYNHHRLFLQGNKKTSTQRFLEKLPERVHVEEMLPPLVY